MKQRIFCGTSLAVLLVVAGLTQADCGVVQRQVIVANNHGFTHGHVAVAPIAVAVPVPLYGASYNPPQPQQEDKSSKIEQLLEQLLNEQRALRADLKGGTASAQETPAAEVEKTIGLLRAKCASCHTEGSEKGELAMFNKTGDMFSFDGVAIVKREIVKRVTSASSPMPPVSHGKLTAAEKSAIASIFK